MLLICIHRQQCEFLSSSFFKTRKTSFNNCIFRLTFGAQIHTINDHSTNRSNWIHHRQHHHQRQAASELASRIVQNGTIGCFSRIGIDGFDLPKDQAGLRMFNARIGCNAQTIGACLTAPCKNNGQCMPKEEVNSYRLVHSIKGLFILYLFF
jgi:hypothetical protein